MITFDVVNRFWSFICFVGCCGLNPGFCAYVAKIPSLGKLNAMSTPPPKSRILEKP